MKYLLFLTLLWASVLSCTESTSPRVAISSGNLLSLASNEEIAVTAAAVLLRDIGKAGYEPATTAILSSPGSAAPKTGTNRPFSFSLASCSTGAAAINGKATGTADQNSASYNIGASFSAELSDCEIQGAKISGIFSGSEHSVFQIASSLQTGTHSGEVSGDLIVNVGTENYSLKFQSVSFIFTANADSLSNTWPGLNPQLVDRTACSGSVIVSGAAARTMTCQDFIRTGLSLTSSTAY